MRNNPMIKTALYKKVLTPEQEANMAKHIDDFVTELNATAPDFKSEVLGITEGLPQREISEAIGAYIEAQDDMVSLIESYVGESQKAKFISLVKQYCLDKIGLSVLLQKMTPIGEQGYVDLVMSQLQSNLAFLPQKIRRLLPRRITIETDPTGKITKMSNQFMAINETLEKKSLTMVALVQAYNRVVAQVKADLTSSKTLVKMSAIITAILMETGIRPGRPGERSRMRAPTGGFLKDAEGEDLYVDTFGATTLNRGHIKFVRENFVELDFLGKDAVRNVATLTNTEVITALQSIMSSPITRAPGEPDYVFRDFHGRVFSHLTLSSYFKQNFAGFSPSDFRDLKATEEHLNELRTQQAALLARIKVHIDAQVADLKERVIDEIALAIEESLKKAQVALNHENLENTINYYVNPVVTLSFLSTAEVQSTLELAVAGDLPALSFDVDKFIEKASGAVTPIGGAPSKKAPRKRAPKISSYRVGSLLDVVEHLEEELSV